MTYRKEDDDNAELSFSNEPIDCCVSIGDMVGSTSIIANIRASHKIAKYYSFAFIARISPRSADPKVEYSSSVPGSLVILVLERP